MKTTIAAALLMLCASLGLGQAQAPAAPASAPTPATAPRTFTLTGVTIHPVSGPDIPSGSVVVRDGKIVSVSPGAAGKTEGTAIPAAGRHVYPSLFPPMTVLGLQEIDARADVAVNFDSELLPVARSGGVLLAGVTPTGGIVSGTVAAIELDGWTREDSTLRVPAAIAVVWPDLRIDRSPEARLSVRLQKKKRDEELQKLRNAFRDARSYGKALAAEGQAGIPRHDADPKLAALIPAVEGKIPVIVLANRLDQIRAAVKWGTEEKLRLAIWGGADAWRMAEELAKAQVPVIVESPLDLPEREDEPYDARFADAGRLDQAGVRVLFNEGGSDGSNVRNLPHLAAASVAFGFPREKALAAMTLEPARLLGVADRVGSLEPGKDATFILTDGDILDMRSRVVAAYLDGRALDLTDKQKRLYERYRNRPKPAGKP
jgi:imidazolonepropionase-like amidohydrolase